MPDIKGIGYGSLLEAYNNKLIEDNDMVSLQRNRGGMSGHPEYHKIEDIKNHLEEVVGINGIWKKSEPKT